MFQQHNIVVSKPHMKPEVLKPAASELNSEEEDAVMPLEYFADYELELQETILQLNSELEGDSDDSFSSKEEDGTGSQSAVESSCVANSGSCSSETDSGDEEDNMVFVHQLQSPRSGVQDTSVPTQECIDQSGGSPYNENAQEFDDYQLLLQNAVHELTSLSHVLVGLGSKHVDQVVSKKESDKVVVYSKGRGVTQIMKHAAKESAVEWLHAPAMRKSVLKVVKGTLCEHAYSALC